MIPKNYILYLTDFFVGKKLNIFEFTLILSDSLNRLNAHLGTTVICFPWNYFGVSLHEILIDSALDV